MSKKFKIILVILIIALISGGGFIWFKKNKKTDAVKKDENVVKKEEVKTENVAPSEIVEIGKDYDDVFDVKKINNKLTFKIKHNNKWFVSYGKDVSSAYDYVDRVEWVDNKLVFTAKKDGKWIVVSDLQEQEQKYDSLKDIKIFPEKQVVVEVEKKDLVNKIEIDGKLAQIEEKDKKFSVTFDNEKIGEDYDFADNLMNIDGKLVFRFKKGVDWFVSYNKEQFDNKYDYIDKIINFNNKLVFTAQEEGKWVIVYQDGTRSIYDQIGELEVVNDKLIFKAKKDDKWVIVYGDKEFGSGYDYIDINGLKIIGDKVAFSAKKDNKWLVFYQDQDFGSGYNNITIIDELNGGLILKLKKVNQWFIGLLGGNNQDIVQVQTKVLETPTVASQDAQDVVFKEIGEGYDSISGGVEIDGKLALSVVKNGKNFILYDGGEFGGGYDNILLYSNIKDSLVLKVFKNNKAYLVYNGEEIGNGYDDIANVEVLDKKIFFKASLNNKWSVYYYDGKNIGQYEYDFVDSLRVINNKIAFIVGSGDDINPDKFFIFYDGQEIGKEYDFAGGKMQGIDGKLAFEARKDGKTIIVYDGREIGKDYDEVDLQFPSPANNQNGFKKLVFTAKKNNKYFMVYDEKVLGGEYDDVDIFFSDAIEINNKLFFKAKKGEKYLAIYDGQEIGGEFDEFTSDPIKVGDKIAFSGKKEGKSVVVTGDEILGLNGEYEQVYDMKSIADKLAFVAKREGRDIVVYDNREVGWQYDGVGFLTDFALGFFDRALLSSDTLMMINGGLAFYTTKKNNFNIFYNNKDYGVDYNVAFFPKLINDKLFFIAANLQNDTLEKMFLVADDKVVVANYDTIFPVSYISGTAEKLFTVLNNPAILDSVNGNVLYEVKKDEKAFILMQEGGQNIKKKLSDSTNQPESGEVDEEAFPQADIVDNPIFETNDDSVKVDLVGEKIAVEDLSRIPLANSNLLLGEMDSDKDGLSGIIEEALGTDKNMDDTDGDSYNDRLEILGGFDPNGVGKLAIDLKFAEKNKGKILIQDDSGQYVWYIDPADGKRYFLGTKNEAFKNMSDLGYEVPVVNVPDDALIKDKEKSVEPTTDSLITP